MLWRNEMKDKILCHDCDAKEGQIHWQGYDMEQYPKCMKRISRLRANIKINKNNPMFIGGGIK